VQILQNDGSAAFFGNNETPLDSQQVSEILGQVNAYFNSAGIRFSLHGAADFESRRSNYLNLDFDVMTDRELLTNPTKKPPRLNEAKHDAALLALARERPDRLSIIAHSGGDWYWNGKRRLWEARPAISMGKSSFCTVSSKRPMTWSHELGHLLGLPHVGRDSIFAPTTFDTVDKIQGAIDRFAEKQPDRNPIDAIDGDVELGIADTPPDPGAAFWGNHKELRRGSPYAYTAPFNRFLSAAIT